MKHILALSTWHHKLWKLQDFSKVQILREINFGESIEVIKLPFLPFLGL